MISADFYPTARTFTNGEITKYFPQYNQSGSNYLEITSAASPDMYYLGWIRWENTPTTFLMSESKNHNINGTPYNTMTMTTPPANFNIGYLGNFDNNYTPYYQNAFNASYVDTQWKQSIGLDTNAYANKGFVNKFAIGAINYSYVTVAYVACLPNSNNTARYYATQNINAEDFETWKESTQTLTFNNIGEITFENNVLNEQFYQDVDVNGTTYRIFIYTYAPFQDRPKNSSNNVDAYTYLAPFLNVSGYGTGPGVAGSGTEEWQILTSSQCATFFDYNSNYGGFEINWGSGYNKNTYRYFPNTGGMGCSQVLHNNNWSYEIYPSGFNGKIDYSWASSNFGFYFDDDTTSNIYVFKDRSDFCCLGRMFTPIDIIHHMSLLPRWKAKSTDPATFGVQDDVYYPEVLPTNEFTGRLITGTRSELLNTLRPWQIDADYWDSNDYTPDDLPPYDPGGDGDDQGSNTGSVLRPTTLGVGGTNGFITQYSLTAAQIAEIGRLLWLSFTDPDYYKNFLFTLTTTGTLNISNLLDYFVSLRVYPFPLINVPSHAVAGQDMWIGAGLVPLSFNTNLHTINNYADYIDAGSCTISRYYNDFRDFAHTQIMLYLPYCGTVQLNPADVVGSTLHAQYAVDFATGGVTAYVDCTTWDGSQFVIAVLTGSIGADIPLTASNAAQIAARIAGDALNFAGTVGEAISSDVGRSAQAIGSAATGDVVGAAIGVANTYAGRIGGALDVAQTGLQIATAEGVKMPMLSGGRGFGSFGAPQTAYVQIRRGIYAEGQQPTQGFKEAYGEAYAKPVQVSSCTGFTVFANVDTSGLQCDAMEREQLKKMMQAGIYI